MNVKTIKCIMQAGLKRTKTIVKDRWGYYVVGYLIGYIVPILMQGIQSWRSLFPIKLIAIVAAIGLGNAYYNSSQKMSKIEIQAKGFKYTIIMLLIFLVAALFQKIILAVWGFNIMLYIGI